MAAERNKRGFERQEQVEDVTIHVLQLNDEVDYLFLNPLSLNVAINNLFFQMHQNNLMLNIIKLILWHEDIPKFDKVLHLGKYRIYRVCLHDYQKGVSGRKN